MKTLLLRLSLLLLFLPFSMARAQDASVAAEGVDWKPFEEAVTLAKAQDKKLIVDVYAPWCPWCRKLQTNVYTDPEVQAYLADHFIVTRLDGDDSEQSLQFKEYTLTQAELAAGLGAEGFPTTVFLASDSEYITRLPGFVDADEFLRVLRFIGTEAFRDASYQEFVQKQQQPE